MRKERLALFSTIDRERLPMECFHDSEAPLTLLLAASLLYSTAPLVACPVGEQAVAYDALDAYQLFEAFDWVGFSASMARLRDDVGCLDEVISPDTAFKVHLAQALDAWIQRDEDHVVAGLTTVRLLDPSYDLCDGIAAPGSGLAELWQRAGKSTQGNTLLVQGGWLFLDGQPGVRSIPARAALVQWVDRDEQVRTWYSWSADTLLPPMLAALPAEWALSYQEDPVESDVFVARDALRPDGTVAGPVWPPQESVPVSSISTTPSVIYRQPVLPEQQFSEQPTSHGSFWMLAAAGATAVLTGVSIVVARDAKEAYQDPEQWYAADRIRAVNTAAGLSAYGFGLATGSLAIGGIIWAEW